MTVQEAVEQRVVRRHNFGLIFRHVQEISTVSDSYVHHVLLELPPRKVNGNHTAATFYHPVEFNRKREWNDASIAETSIIVGAVSQELLYTQSLLDDIYNLFPEVQPSVLSGRQRRFWCFQLCWGIADAADVEILKETTNKTSRNFEKIQKSIDAMASYSHLTDKKFEAIKAIVERQQINSNLMGRAVTNTQFLTATMMNLFIPNVIHLTHVHTALSLLKHNILTFDLIPLAHAEQIYSQIKEHMEQEWPMHFLVHKEAQSLYTAADLAYFRTGSNLHVGFKVKVSVFQAPLQLFKIEKIPLEFPNQGHDTNLTDLPQYIAMNDVDSDFLVFNQMPRLLRDQYYLLHDQDHVIRSKLVPTCLMALFDDRLAQAVKLCNSILQPFSNTPVLRHVGANLILLKNIPTYEVITRLNESVLVQSQCVACLKQVACGSRVQAGEVIYVPNCRDSASWMTSTVSAHLLNLQAIGPLLTDQLLETLSAEFTFQNQVNVSLPNLTFYQSQDDQKLTDAFHTLDLSSLQLTAAINQSLETGFVFTSANDHLRYKLSVQSLTQKLKAGWDSFTSFIQNPFGIVSNLLSILQWIAIVYLMFRVHCVGAVLGVRQVAAQAIKTANASHVRGLEQFFYRPTTTPKPVIEYRPQISSDFHVLDLCIFMILAVMGLYLVYRFTVNISQKNTTQVFVDLIGSKDNVLVQVLTLPHQSNMYTYKATHFVEQVAVKGLLFPQLRIFWPSFLISHRLLSRTTRLPLSCFINPYKAYRIRRILATHYELLLFVREGAGKSLKLMPLEGSTWQQIQKEIGNSSQEDDSLWTTRGELESPPQYV
jgi:hypothetical protein